MDSIRNVLTTRGRAFVAAGVTLALSGIGFGFADLTRIGVLLTFLPLLAAIASRRTRLELSVVRVVRPAPLTVGQSATVEVELHNATTRAFPVLVAREQVPYVLGDRPRAVIPKMEPGDRRQVTYQVCSEVRGRHHLGPLRVRAEDPFGLTSVTSTAGGTTSVLVLPQVEPLGGGRPRGDGVGAEGAVPHMVALHGEDDVSIREYRDGDDLRRVHWPATAHQGELMVRQEDRPARRRAVLILDSRASAHAGRGPAGSFEWAVGALASIAAHLAHSSYAVHLVSRETVQDGLATQMLELDVALESFALAHEGPDLAFEESMRHASPLTSAGGLVIAAVTDHDEQALRQVASLRQPGGTGLLLLLDTASFGSSRTGGAGARTVALADLVRSAGWSTVVVRSGDTVAGAWTALNARGGVTAGVR